MKKQPGNPYKNIKFLSSPQRFSKKNAIIVAIVLATIGSIAIVVSRAVIPTAFVEPENSTVTSPAQVKTGDNTVSGGKYLQFGSGQSDKMLYDSNRTGNYEIYKMDMKTSAVTQLTNDPTYDSWWGKASPDGKQMIFNRTPKGVHDTQYEKVSLWKANIDGSNAHQIIARGANGWGLQGHAEWSPDGTKLVMYGGTSIWITDTNGNLLKSLVNGIDPIWSSDGSKIIYFACQLPPGCMQGTYQLASINIDGTGQRNLTGILPQLTGNDPTMSPDGTTIVWEANINNFFKWDLMAANSDGSNVRILFTDDLINTCPVWSPDSKTIYFFKSKPFYNINIWSIKPDGSNLTLITGGQPGINEFPDYFVGQ